MAAGIAALAIGLLLRAGLFHGVDPDDVEPRVEPAGVTVIAKTGPWDLEGRAEHGAWLPGNEGMRVASLETDVALETEGDEAHSASSEPEPPRASFMERFRFGELLASFGDRFTGEMDPPARGAANAETLGYANEDPRPRAAPESRATATPARGQSQRVASLPSAGETPQPRPPQAPKELALPPDIGGRTAIYDIAAHTVYLPDGHKLEAHSGLGGRMDDPRFVNMRGKGPTPPNVYQLTLREHLFHGVRALRLTPLDEGKMFGRDGILAHTYMLGSSGQSNGCVSFSNYPAFLNAYLNGEVNRLVVVERLATAPGPKTASGWIPDSIKNLFRRS